MMSPIVLYPWSAGGGLGAVRLLEDTRVGLRDHLLAEVDADQVLLKMLWSNMYRRPRRGSDLLAQRRRTTPYAVFCM
jgi:hypothetical protein